MNVCVCVYVRLCEGTRLGLIMLLWGVIVNQSGRVQQSVIKFTIYSLPLSFVMPFAVLSTHMGITVQQENPVLCVILLH